MKPEALSWAESTEQLHPEACFQEVSAWIFTVSGTRHLSKSAYGIQRNKPKTLQTNEISLLSKFALPSRSFHCSSIYEARVINFAVPSRELLWYWKYSWVEFHWNKAFSYEAALGTLKACECPFDWLLWLSFIFNFLCGWTPNWLFCVRFFHCTIFFLLSLLSLGFVSMFPVFYKWLSHYVLKKHLHSICSLKD